MKLSHLFNLFFFLILIPLAILFFFKSKLLSIYLTSALKLPVIVQKTEISTSGIILKDIRVKNDNKLQQHPYFQAKNISLTINFKSMLEEGPIIHQFNINDLSLDIRFPLLLEEKGVFAKRNDGNRTDIEKKMVLVIEELRINNLHFVLNNNPIMKTAEVTINNPNNDKTLGMTELLKSYCKLIYRKVSLPILMDYLSENSPEEMSKVMKSLLYLESK